jgi:hypothetical protein
MSKSRRQEEIEELEDAFWKSIVDDAPKVATAMLAEPALMVSGHGVNKFDHAGYIKMAKGGKYKLIDYKVSKMDVLFPADDVAIATYHVNQTMEMDGKPMEMDSVDSSTWIKAGDSWKCAMHTESPVPSKGE